MPANDSTPATETPTHYHVCFAVPDLEAAMDELHQMTGATFGSPRESTLGPWSYRIAFTDRFPVIELIQGSPGSPWHTDAPRFDHLGWWSPDLDTTASCWSQAGAAMAFDGREHGRRFLYMHAPSSGVTLEAVDATQKADFISAWIRSD